MPSKSCYHTHMKRPHFVLLGFALACLNSDVVFAESFHVQAEAASPIEIARIHESMVTDGFGALYPENSQAHVPGGIATFGGGEDSWPPLFLLGLVPRADNGVTVYPFMVELDDDTGEALFRNANGTLFYSVAPTYTPAPEWFRLRLGLPSFGPVPAYRELSHLVS